MNNTKKEQLVQKLYETYPYPGRGLANKKEALRYVVWVSRIFGETNSFWKGKSILELGCGTGELAVGLAVAGAKVHALDLSHTSILQAQKNAKKLGVNVHFEQQNMLHFDERTPSGKPKKYDVVIALGSLHHTVHARKGFAIGANHLKRNGIFIVGLYNKYSRARHRVKRLILWALCGNNIEQRIAFGEKWFGGNYSKSWSADKYGQVHESYHSLSEVKRWLKEEQIEYFASNPKHKHPFIDEIRWLLEKRNAFFVIIGKK